MTPPQPNDLGHWGNASNSSPIFKCYRCGPVRNKWGTNLDTLCCLCKDSLVIQGRKIPLASFFEFFAGGGMARAGLGPTWDCAFANDFDAKKGLTYQLNWGPGRLLVEDVKRVKARDIEGHADLVWGSFPCQDLSLAGGGAGLRGQRSGTFYPFWEIITGLIADKRAPKLVALENVCGTITSHGGKDFSAICRTFTKSGYRFGALVIDAALFVPQSRPRLFFVGVKSDVEIPEGLTAPGPLQPFHSRSLVNAHAAISEANRKQWLWWNVPPPPTRIHSFADLIEDSPASVTWHSAAETKQLLSLMSPINLAKVNAAKRSGRLMVGGVYKRTRLNENGKKVQRAEVRFDDVSGCLRTPAGGSSRQVILVIEGNRVRSRLISSRETARLMGLPDSYKLPKNYNEAYHLTGDGVVVPVVGHLTRYLFEPLLGCAQRSSDEARANNALAMSNR